MMNWKQLISNKRLGQEAHHPKRHDDRTEFKRDYDRLIFSAPFRRMQNKTQVFPLPGSIFVHNRLTHSLEVASVGRSLGFGVFQKLIAIHPELENSLFPEIDSIVSAACLAHDMGNPPFGHSGEKAIQTFFTEGPGANLKSQLCSTFWDDITHFEGNANAFRLLTHRFKGRRAGGFVLTYSCLASIVKYPFASFFAGEHGKFGFFESERSTYEKIADELGIIRITPSNEMPKYVRHPLVYLVEAADDICYEIMDIEDAHKLRLLTSDETISLLLTYFEDSTQTRIMKRINDEGVTDVNEKIVYLRSCVISYLVNECVNVFAQNETKILNGTFSEGLIENISERPRKAYKHCTKISSKEIYKSKPVVDIELAGYKIMTTLLQEMTEAATHPEHFYSQQLFKRVSSQYEIDATDLETRLMAVIDYISGMTDIYSLDIYQKINGMSLPIV